MRTLLRMLTLIAVVLHGHQVRANVLYVSANAPNPTVPYNTWSTAALTIQQAVNAGHSGDTILVTNGTYASGSEIVSGTTPSRVAVTMPLSIQSVNGPSVTSITGSYGTRCVYLTNGAVLAGFKLSGGGATLSGESVQVGSGGGVWCS